MVSLTGLAPNAWGWARTTTNGVTATLPVTTTGPQTISVWMREDGLRLDRLLLTTDTTYVPTGFGPAETPRLLANRLIVPLDRTIVYTYDNLYRLTDADYSTGELYEYEYDPVGNRLQQIINGDTTTYTYDDANRLDQVTHQSTVVSYQFDDNGNLLKTGVLTNAFDAANRLTSTVRAETTPVLPQYNGVGDRVAQTVGGTTVYYALDVVGLPEVIQTSEGNSYLHLPGVIMAESSIGEVRYLLSDGLGSIRQAVDETGEVVSSDEYDPYGNPPTQHASRITPYAYTGEWWQEEVGLLHLRARWYLAEVGAFLSRDAVEGEPPYLYVRGNPVNFTDPSGMCAEFGDDACWNVYEQIIQLCPECATMSRPTLTGDRLLHQENTQYLQTVLQRVQTGWRPTASYHPNLNYRYGIAFWSSIYDKTNPLWNCASGDDKQYLPSDTIYDFMRDFVCEWGNDQRNFGQNDYLTIQLRKSQGIEQARQNFFNRLTVLGLSPGDKVSGYRRFSYREFIGATVEIPIIGLLPHILGSYSYVIYYEAPGKIRFTVTNPINRQSGSRIPNMFEGPSAEEVLYSSQKVESIQSYLAFKTREQTIDPEGGGAMVMKFSWTEFFVDLCTTVPPMLSLEPQKPTFIPLSTPTP